MIMIIIIGFKNVSLLFQITVMIASNNRVNFNLIACWREVAIYISKKRQYDTGAGVSLESLKATFPVSHVSVPYFRSEK